MRDLIKVFENALGKNHSTMACRWLTSFDYCRTEPIALEAIRSLPNSSVRIFDAEFCLSRECTPRVPFHPKAFFVRNSDYEYLLAGSGNISRSGLARGYEAGLSVGIDLKATPKKSSAFRSMQQSRKWFDAAWGGALPLSDKILSRYTSIFESVDRQKSPAITEDDIASDHPTNGALRNADLQKLRICRNFWIEAGNITKNRGPNLPGNQLMMKRLTRVYFGFPPTVAPENSAIGTVELSFGGGDFDDYSVTYSDNKMDKLVLPIPGADGPASYDQKNLIFRNVAPGRFELSIGSDADKKGWLRNSKKIDANFAMKGGRKWGVF
ncbi:hypothetical protein [Tranquillimonas rosea]|nr:hypothetical protein [Tranquillimonas rosea]